MRIVVDAQGGDNAPREILKGVLKFLNENREQDVEIILTGNVKTLEKECPVYFKKCKKRNDKITIVNTEDIVEMDESPSVAIKKSKSSMMVGLNLVREGKGDAFVSAGNSGAVMAGALLKIGRIHGIHRPALATVMPSFTGSINLLIDVGANVDTKSRNLLEFSLMASIYLKSVFGLENPKGWICI